MPGRDSTWNSYILAIDQPLVMCEKWAKLNWQHHLGGSSCFLFFGRLLLLWKLAALVLAKNLEQTPVPTHFAAMHFLNFSDTDLECLSCPHFLPSPVTVSE